MQAAGCQPLRRSSFSATDPRPGFRRLHLRLCRQHLHLSHGDLEPAVPDRPAAPRARAPQRSGGRDQLRTRAGGVRGPSRSGARDQPRDADVRHRPQHDLHRRPRPGGPVDHCEWTHNRPIVAARASEESLRINTRVTYTAISDAGACGLTSGRSEFPDCSAARPRETGCPPTGQTGFRARSAVPLPGRSRAGRCSPSTASTRSGQASTSCAPTTSTSRSTSRRTTSRTFTRSSQGSPRSATRAPVTSTSTSATSTTGTSIPPSRTVSTWWRTRP